jgi:type I restriction enzyme S subunit
MGCSMSEAWEPTTIRRCLSDAFAGEWGGDPKPGNALVLRATDIDDDGLIVGGGALRQIPIGKLTAKQLLPGDILLEGSGGGPEKPVGRVAYYAGPVTDKPAVCSNFFKTLRPARDRVDPRFFAKKLEWFYRQAPILALQQQTTGIINLKFEEYLDSEIFVPRALEEQSTVAHILDTLEAAIHETEAILTKLKAVKQGLLHDLLTRGIDANGELRPPQVEAPHLYEQSSLGWIPMNWQVAPLSSRIASLDAGVSVNSEDRPHGSGEVGVLKTSALSQGRFLSTQNKAVVARERTLVREAVLGDSILVSRMNTPELVGESCYVSRPWPTLFLPDRIWQLKRSSTDSVDMRWLSYVLLTARYRAYVQVNATGTSGSMKNLPKSRLFAMLVAFPCTDEQTKIAARMAAADERVASEESFLEKLRAQKSGLMDDLLTGRVRVTPLLSGVAPEEDRT